jgi:RND family efflux transporter MFP subunit
MKTTLGCVLLSLSFACACEEKENGHDHSSDHPQGHDHHDEGHGHGGTPMVRITLWSERLELFAEHPVAARGANVEWLAHLTVLDGFRPLERAQARLELQGPEPLTAEAKASERAGAYELSIVAKKAGTYRGRLVVSGSVTDTIEGVVLEVHDAAEKSEEHEEGEHEDDEHERFIELLKEQQWGVPFATAFAGQGTLIGSIEVAGTVTTPPSGSAEIGAPTAGRLIAPAGGLPRPGDSVRKGQVLATLAPAPSSPEEAARATLAVSEAEARLARARAAVERSERLIRDQAVAQREVEEARREVSVAGEALRAARSAQQLFSGATGGSGSGSWRLVSPIDGTLVEVSATPGASVLPGSVLFRVVDVRELWIRARVPEQDAARLRSDRDAAFQIAGLPDYLPIDVTGQDASASLVTVGRTVDPTSRTVDVIYALRAADPRLRVGGLVRVSLPVGEDFTGIVVPRSAIVDDEGREVVYVQADGEHFEERQVKTGPRQGDRIGILHGLSGRERLVVRGAHVVRLAARSGSTEAHGHIH